MFQTKRFRSSQFGLRMRFSSAPRGEESHSHVGRLYERKVHQFLVNRFPQTLQGQLWHCGKAGDEGIDLQGRIYWPNEITPWYLWIQCKSSRLKRTPSSTIRDLEASLARRISEHAVKERHVAWIVTPQFMTSDALMYLKASPWPLAWLQWDDSEQNSLAMRWFFNDAIQSLLPELMIARNGNQEQTLLYNGRELQ